MTRLMTASAPRFGQVYVMPAGHFDFNFPFKVEEDITKATGDGAFSSKGQTTTALTQIQLDLSGFRPPDYPEGPYDVFISNTNRPSVEAFSQERAELSGRSLWDLEDDGDRPRLEAQLPGFLQDEYNAGGLTFVPLDQLPSPVLPTTTEPQSPKGDTNRVQHTVDLPSVLSQLANALSGPQLMAFVDETVGEVVAGLGELLPASAHGTFQTLLTNALKRRFKQTLDEDAKRGDDPSKAPSV